MSADGRAAADAVLTQAWGTVPASLREPCLRMASAAGERLPGGLVLAVAGRAWPGTSRRTATAAAAVELLQLGTQVHDDLRDDAPVRRDVPTINAKEGPAVALHAGDLLIGLAYRLAATAGVGTVLADALIDRCAGQALAADTRFSRDPAVATAVRIAELTTGALFAAACRLGAIVTAAPPDGLSDFGQSFGAAVHLLDDLPRTGPDVTTTLTAVEDLVQRAAAARPDLAELPRRYRDSRLARPLSR
jgi:geranylgeranyl pyrophosphate synthase